MRIRGDVIYVYKVIYGNLRIWGKYMRIWGTNMEGGLEAVRERQQEVLAVHLIYDGRFLIYVYEVMHGNIRIWGTYMRIWGTYMRGDVEAMRERQQELLAVHLHTEGNRFYDR